MERGYKLRDSFFFSLCVKVANSCAAATWRPMEGGDLTKLPIYLKLDL